jgi:hypothetical protein
MDRVQHSTAVSTLPTSTFSGTIGFYSDTTPTWVTAGHLNQLQEELYGTITFAGITPSNVDYTQLRQSISYISTHPTTGITFPATFVNSTNVNTLDDYEEGTWTPTLVSGFTTTGTVANTGFYTKIGNTVTVWYTLSATTIVIAAGANVGGLPFVTAGPATGISVNAGATQGSSIVANGTATTYVSALTSSGSFLASFTYRT